MKDYSLSLSLTNIPQRVCQYLRLFRVKTVNVRPLGPLVCHIQGQVLGRPSFGLFPSTKSRSGFRPFWLQGRVPLICPPFVLWVGKQDEFGSGLTSPTGLVPRGRRDESDVQGYDQGRSL